MPDLRAALLQAALQAERLHRKYHSRDEVHRGRVDVLGMIWDLQVPVIFRPLNGLLGAYLNDPTPGIMITTKRPLPVQRFTAAHELGHAILEHASSLDNQYVLTRAYEKFSPVSSFDQREFEANAFATRLLTPSWLIAEHMRNQSWRPEDLTDPANVYQLSLRMGSSYEATCYALVSHQVLSGKDSAKLLSVARRTIKSSLVPSAYHPPNWYGDVWVVTERDSGIVIEGGSNDMVIFNLREHAAAGYLWELSQISEKRFNVLTDVQNPVTSLHVGGISVRTIITNTVDRPHGHLTMSENRPWDESIPPLSTLSLDVDMSSPMEAGLYIKERKAMLSATE